MTEHDIRLDRYERGRSAVYNRPTYGYCVRCSCGHVERVNGTKREATVAANEHRRGAAR